MIARSSPGSLAVKCSAIEQENASLVVTVVAGEVALAWPSPEAVRDSIVAAT